MPSTEAHFDAISEQYDRNNTLLSLGICKLWNRALIKAVPCQGTLLDLCAGTGAIAFAYKECTEMILLDQCQAMLDVAKKKAPENCRLILADAQKIPLDDNSVDAVTTAYGIRNIEDPAKCAREVLRVLKPGGTWGILELTLPSSPLLRTLHKIYLKQIIPTIGSLFSSSKEAYQYLAKSVEEFVLPDRILLDVGFSELKVRPLTGGIATLLLAKK